MANHHRPDQRTRVLRGLQLRIAGHTWQSIAEETGYWSTEAGARRAINSLLDKWESATVDEYRIIQTGRYEELVRAWWPRATGAEKDGDGDPLPPDDRAAAVVIKVMDAINRLHALNREEDPGTAPRMSPEEFRAALAEHAALTAANQRPAAIEGPPQ
ncbi:hypothetical protein ACPESR_25105 [Nocardia testacea]|uniref:hypothetical protein n=1 Tax=Nocardia testacea TaxID=248551 RepID=UPI003C2CC0D1